MTTNHRVAIDPAKYPPPEPDGEIQVEHTAYRDAIRKALQKYATRPVLAMMDACIDCGQCARACHYYVSEPDKSLIPAMKARRLTQLLRRAFHPVRSRLVPGADDAVSDASLEALFDASFRNCTLCGKCALTCPMGISTGEILYLARAMLASIGRLPSGLEKPVETAFEVGNYLGLTTEDFIENIEWIAEEMADDIGVEDFSIPIDKKNAEVLYVPHPLEARDLPFLLMYAIKILHFAGEDYTISSYNFDTVNYAFYQGSKDNMMRIAQRMLDARVKLQAKRIALAPCGHGYRVMRWEVEKYLGKPFTFPPVQTIAELIDGYLRHGRIRLVKDTFEGPMTYHDPCNITRRGGVLQAPRNIAKELTSNYVEMQPHGARNYCCGGGGGLASTGDYGQLRITMGKKKAEQIRQTGAKIVITNCFNCMTQIRDLSKAYDLGVEAKSIVELVAESLGPNVGAHRP